MGVPVSENGGTQHSHTGGSCSTHLLDLVPRACPLCCRWYALMSFRTLIGTYHAVFHTGNGQDSAGTHCYSADGKVWYGQESPPAYTGHMSWAVDTAQPYAGKETVLARRERPQILLAGEAGNGSSYGTPYLLFTSAEDCVFSHMPDGGFGDLCSSVAKDKAAIGTTKSYTVLAEVAH